MAINVGSLYWSAGIRTKELVKDAKTIKSQFGGLSKSGSALGSVFSPKNLGIAGIATALGAAGKAAFDFSKEYETAFASVRTITNESTEGINDMEQAVIDMTQTIPIGATEGAEALYQIVSAGYDGAEGLQLLEVSARAAVGGITDTATAADGITTILNSYGKEASEASYISDVLFTTVRLGKTTFGELAASISNIAPLAASSGISFEEISASIATLTKQGVPTAQAITQIRSAVLATTEVLGDAAFEGRTLQDAFQAVRDSANGSNSALRESLGRVEALNAVLGLTGDNAKTAASDLEGISTATGAAADAFEVMVETADSQLKLLQNNIKAASKNVGDFLLVNSSGFIKKINRLFEDDNVRIASKASKIANEAKINADKIADAEERRESISKKILELEKQKLDYSNDIVEARKKINAAILPEIFEVPSVALGFKGDFTPVTENKAIVRYATEQYDALDEAQEELQKYLFAIEEGNKKLNEDTPEIEIKLKTLGDLKTELKALQEQLDAVPIEEAPTVNLKIDAKRDEIDKALEVIKEEAEAVTIEPIINAQNVRVGYSESGLQSDIKELQNQKGLAVTYKERAELQNKINVLQKKYSQIINETNSKLRGLDNNVKNINKSTDKGINKATLRWDDYIAVINETNKVINDVVDSFGELDEASQSILSGVSDSISGVFGLATAFEAASTAASALEKSTVILAAISSALKIFTAIGNISKGNEERRTEEYLTQLGIIHASNVALVEQNKLYAEGNSYFSDDKWGTALAGLEAYNQALGFQDNILGELGNSQRDATQTNQAFLVGALSTFALIGQIGTKNEKKQIEAIQKQAKTLETEVEKALGGIAVKTRDRSGVANFFGAADEYESLLKVYPDIINANGSINAEMLKQATNSADLSKADKARLENLIELSELAEESIAQFGDYINSVFGGAGDEVAKAFQTMYETGEDAMLSLQKSFSRMIEAFTNDAIEFALLQPYLNTLNETTRGLGESFARGDIDDKELTSGIIGAIGGFYDELSSIQPIALDLYKQADELAASAGFEDAFSGEGGSAAAETQGLTGSVGSQITEDKGTELVGLWTRTSFDTRAILSANQEMISIQQQIADNTLRTAEGVDLINSRYAGQSTDRDSGNVF